MKKIINREEHSYFKSSLAHLITFLGIIGLLTLFAGAGFIGIQYGLTKLEIKTCKSYQSYVIEYPESSIRDEDVTRCAILDIIIEQKVL